ncbi:HAMP domain-containing sensor histidine kinase [Clostridium sp. JS66]|uniref:HAMP domain-containing sensor histidine kinase n=1 Tax=Clostridium sp. JS66 TaxID=3064705 RepID=UPI00298E12BC|nr:HAMP domain-containing sensor histidine kinase [Clostridium sp. JS66]WPC42441.1 HAMP domain-containing sensor histidine kinase [Clostridium sp. JS66]
MKKTTIKWRIFKYNLIIIIMLITLTTIIFNIAIRLYFEKDLFMQLNKIASNTERIALQHGPDFFVKSEKVPSPPPSPQNSNSLIHFYFMLDRSLRDSLTVLNANYILLDKSKNILTPFPRESSVNSADILKQINETANKSKKLSSKNYLNFYLSGTEYIALVKPVSEKNSFGLGWIIIYSNIEKVKQLQIGINIILSIILIFSSLIILIFSSILSKKISSPFSTLSQHIRSIAERNFDTKINMSVDDELREFVNNINIMSEKLEIYDKAQKTFFQNASHEFRTPLMSIQSYAEGIKYKVVDTDEAADIIIDETKRLTRLVEDLLYLSRLNTIDDNYHYNNLDFNDLIKSCVRRMNTITVNNNIKIILNNIDKKIEINADEEKLSRAITNIISNCIRYASSAVILTVKVIDSKILLTISDDGVGFQKNDLPNIFERFYKGKKGNFGLGLPISKNIIEKHNGKIIAKNSDSGALFIIELPLIKIT